MAKTTKRLTEAERAERRARDRERLKEAAETLLTSEGWRRWVRVRSTFHRYSFQNTLLIALQRPDATYVAGFRAWLKLGRCVRKGEKAIRIWAPMRVTERDDLGDEAEEQRIVFRVVSVFDVTQTDRLPGVDPIPLEPPSARIAGDSHAHLIDPLVELAHEEGYGVDFREIASDAQGWCDYAAKRIVVDESLAPNAAVRVLVHELAHALGASYAEFGRAQAEVIVDTAAYVVCASAGLDTGGESVPYIAGWGEEEAIEAVTKAAETIDAIATRIERGLERARRAR